LPVDELIRFARAPDGTIAPDVRRRLPGRGVWVTASRKAVAEAVRKKLFSRAFRAEARASDDLPAMVGAQLKELALGRLGMERKAGRLKVGFAEVDAMLRGGRAGLLLHAADAAADGVRKLDQAAHAGAGLAGASGGEPPYRCRAFTSVEMSLALGRGNVIHAALEKGGASDAVIARCRLVDRFFGEVERAAGTPPDEFAGRTE
jgi:uncharacterized protein